MFTKIKTQKSKSKTIHVAEKPGFAFLIFYIK